jgi:hypothetical protein
VHSVVAPVREPAMTAFIVVRTAAHRGIALGWRRHARVGVPVTLGTLAITACYLWARLTMMGSAAQLSG